LALVSSYR